MFIGDTEIVITSEADIYAEDMVRGYLMVHMPERLAMPETEQRKSLVMVSLASDFATIENKVSHIKALSGRCLIVQIHKSETLPAIIAGEKVMPWSLEAIANFITST